MFQHNEAPFRIILVCVAMVFFGFAAIAWNPPVEPYRVRLLAAGMFCLSLSTFF